MDSLSKRDQMRREEVIIDKDRVESVLYQTVGNKRLRELCIDYWYLWVSKLTSCEGFSKNNSNNLSHWSTKQLFQMFAVFMCLCLCIWAHGRWQDQDGGKEERREQQRKAERSSQTRLRRHLPVGFLVFFFFTKIIAHRVQPCIQLKETVAEKKLFSVHILVYWRLRDNNISLKP